LQGREVRIVERGVECAEAIRPLGMSDRRQMLKKCRVMQKEGCHTKVRRGCGGIWVSMTAFVNPSCFAASNRSVDANYKPLSTLETRRKKSRRSIRL
jgi:hypothetical protein